MPSGCRVDEMFRRRFSGVQRVQFLEMARRNSWTAAHFRSFTRVSMSASGRAGRCARRRWSRPQSRVTGHRLNSGISHGSRARPGPPPGAESLLRTSIARDHQMATDVVRMAKTDGAERPATGDELVRPAVIIGVGTECRQHFRNSSRSSPHAVLSRPFRPCARRRGPARFRAPVEREASAANEGTERALASDGTRRGTSVLGTRLATRSAPANCGVGSLRRGCRRCDSSRPWAKWPTTWRGQHTVGTSRLSAPLRRGRASERLAGHARRPRRQCPSHARTSLHSGSGRTRAAGRGVTESSPPARLHR